MMKKQKQTQYKYDEDVALLELKAYIDATYDQHYSRNKFQATEFIIDSGHGEGFCIGNIMKYAQRYGKKGSKIDARNSFKSYIATSFGKFSSMFAFAIIFFIELIVIRVLPFLITKF